MLYKLQNGRPLRKRRSPNWVSKTDLRKYVFSRCRQAFWMIDQGKVTESISEQKTAHIQQGIAFQESVEASAVPREIPLAELPKVMTQESIRLLGVPVFENEGLQIFGQPDGIDTA
jgi:uncharacterized circularly permuted ATP-grasp superfamily protein